MDFRNYGLGSFQVHGCEPPVPLPGPIAPPGSPAPVQRQNAFIVPKRMPKFVDPNFQSKFWCYTINNPTEEDLQISPFEYSYHVYGHEIGENGVSHIQGYIEMRAKTRLSRMKTVFPRAHLEPRRGTAKQASDYCKKDGDFQEFGVISCPQSKGISGGEATKRKWDEVKTLAQSGNLDSIDSGIFVRNYNSLKRIKQDYETRKDSLAKVCGIWFVGAPNTGKSFAARQRWPDLYDKPCNKWWDGYRGEETVLIDDFDPIHKVLGHHLKRWSDRYSFPAEQKGTTIQIRPKRIVVTSNYLIDEIFAEDRVLMEAIKRRFKVEHFTKVYVSEESEDSEATVEFDSQLPNLICNELLNSDEN